MNNLYGIVLLIVFSMITGGSIVGIYVERGIKSGEITIDGKIYTVKELKNKECVNNLSCKE